MPVLGGTTGIIMLVGTVVRWLRIVSGISLAVLLLAALPAVAAGDTSEPTLRVVMAVLGLLAFALLAAGWALAARWQSAGMVLRGGGLVLFGLAMAAYVVTALEMPAWLAWALFGLFSAAVLAFPVWLVMGRGSSRLPVEPDAHGRLEVPVARVSMLMLAVLAGAMATGAVVVIRAPLFGWVVGTVGLVFFGGAFAWLVLLAVRPGPAIRADSHGLEDRSSLVVGGWIAWAELTRIRATTTFGQPTIALTPHDWSGVVGRQPAWKRALLGLSRRLTGSNDLLLSSTALPCRARDLAKALEAMRRANTRARGSA